MPSLIIVWHAGHWRPLVFTVKTMEVMKQKRQKRFQCKNEVIFPYAFQNAFLGLPDLERSDFCLFENNLIKVAFSQTRPLFSNIWWYFQLFSTIVIVHWTFFWGVENFFSQRKWKQECHKVLIIPQWPLSFFCQTEWELMHAWRSSEQRQKKWKRKSEKIAWERK